MRIFFLFNLLCCAAIVSSVTAQREQTLLYEGFDQTVGKSNLGLYNGTIHFNNLKPYNKTHRYFGTDSYQAASVIYDGQFYPNIQAKYDVLTDVLVVKSDDESSLLGINLIGEKTASFSIAGKHFVNLAKQIPVPAFVQGFYEETAIGDKMWLYTKYQKVKIEVLRSDGAAYKFEQEVNFVGRWGAALFRIDGKRAIVNQFPDQRKLIQQFFTRHTALEKENEQLFYLTLLRKIDVERLKLKS